MNTGREPSVGKHIESLVKAAAHIKGEGKDSMVYWLAILEKSALSLA